MPCPGRASATPVSTRCLRPESSFMQARSVSSSSTLGRIRRPTATTVSAASTSASGSFAATAWAFSRASRSACSRGSSPLGTLLSTSAGTIALGVTPMRASRSRRRGLAEARISRILWVSGRSCASGHEAIRDPPLGQVVRRELDQHFIAGQDADAVLAHLAGGVAEYLMAILEAHAEHRIGQQLNHRAAHLEQFFLGQAIPSSYSGKKSRSLTLRSQEREGV